MKRYARRCVFASLAFALLAVWPIDAQVVGGGVGPGAAGGPAVGEQRALLERRFRQRSAEVVRRQLRLNADQMSRLQLVNQQFDRQRISLVADERRTRQALRAELMAGDGANQQKVGDLLDQLIRLQRQRVDLIATEQRELGKFMTPVQRAKYFGLQNQLRKRMQELGERGESRPALGGRQQRPLMGRRKLR